MPWHAKATGAYLKESTEAYDNAIMAYGILSSRGFSLPAFCGMWGNVQSESGYNPFRWQSDIVLPGGDPRIDYQNGHAYGLVQWDPASKYINGGASYPGYNPNYSDRSGSPDDGSAQMIFLDATAVSSGQYIPSASYNLSYTQYKAASIDTYSIDYLTRAWFYNYERGTWDSGRVTAAQYWYDTLGGIVHDRIPIWLMFKLKEVNRF